MDFTGEVERQVNEWWEKAKENAAENLGEFSEALYEPPSDEPLEWERDGKLAGVIKTDAPVMAAQLFAGLVCQRILPLLLEQRLALTISKIETWIGSKVVGGGLKKALGRLGGVAKLALELLEVWQQTKFEAAIERAIRKMGLSMRRELLELALKRAGDRKKTERVYSRHHTPKQRHYDN